jgi:hypothetical protein
MGSRKPVSHEQKHRAFGLRMDEVLNELSDLPYLCQSLENSYEWARRTRGSYL